MTTEGLSVSSVFHDDRDSGEYTIESPPVLYAIASENRFVLDPAFVARYRDREPQWGPVGRVVYERTYSRRKDDGTYERFWETCVRVVEGAFSILKQHQRNNHLRFDDVEGQRKAQDMYERMFAFKFLPPGRGLWFMGTKALELKGSAALNNCGFVSTENLDVDFAEAFCALMDFSMLGVGMGFDVLGAGKVTILTPVWDPRAPFVVEDTREGWVDAVRTVLNAFVGRGRLPTVFDYSKVRPEGAPLSTFGGTASGPEPLQQLLDALAERLFARIGQTFGTADIVDVMNLIGKCVVAGNVRRSSEIALGSPDDPMFVGLKDPTELSALIAKQHHYETGNDVWCDYQNTIDGLQKDLARLDVLDPQYGEKQGQINALIALQRETMAYDPTWVALQKRIDAHPLRSHRWASNNTVLCKVSDLFDDLADMTVRNGEPGYGFMDTIREYGRLADPPNGLDRKAKGFNPCAEQTLWDGELCCLVETFPTNHATLEDWQATLKMAYLYAKIVTLVPTHRPATNAIMLRNRRIGTSMAGIWEMYETKGLQECIRWWDAGYKFICELDQEYSGWMGIPQSIKHTSIKPGGTIPLLVGKEGGMKLPNGEYFFRTIRVAHDHPMVAAYRNAGYRVEADLTTPRTVVIYFPVSLAAMSPAGKVVRTAKQVTIWEQLALCAALQAYWADNMVSATITFQPHEAQDLKHALRVYANKLKAISFLPLLDHRYPQAPYIECTAQQYTAYLHGLREVADYRTAGELHDTEEKFCDGASCEIRLA